MLPSSPSADYISDATLRLCFGRAVFCCPFPGELGSTTAHLRRLPRKGRAGGAQNLCSSIACRAQPCQRCTPVQQALIYLKLYFCSPALAEPFLFVALLRTKRNTPAPLGRGCSAVIGNVRWKRKASFAAGSWPGSRSPGPMRRCGRRSARCAQRAARRIPGG